MNQKNSCKYYNECSAPLCPILSDEENKKGLWYPDEEICRRKRNLPLWVHQQLNIAVKAKVENHGLCFILDMLKIAFEVTPDVKGLNSSNRNERGQLKTWFRTYPATEKGLNEALLRTKTKSQLILELILSPDDEISSPSAETVEGTKFNQQSEVK